MFTALLLLLVFIAVMVKNGNIYPLNGNSINIIAKIALFVIFALGILLPIMTTLIIRTNKKLNNAYVFIPAISLLIGILLQYLIYKVISLWILIIVSPTLTSTIFNKLMLDDSKNKYEMNEKN